MRLERKEIHSSTR